MAGRHREPAQCHRAVRLKTVTTVSCVLILLWLQKQGFHDAPSTAAEGQGRAPGLPDGNGPDGRSEAGTRGAPGKESRCRALDQSSSLTGSFRL